MYPYSPYQNQLNNLQNQFMPAPAIQYVNGRQSADGYMMQPNSSVILMDSEKDRFYLKKADASGACTLKAYDFVEAEEEEKPDYISRSEFEELKKLIKENHYEQHNEPIYQSSTASQPGTVIVG